MSAEWLETPPLIKSFTGGFAEDDDDDDGADFKAV